MPEWGIPEKSIKNVAQRPWPEAQKPKTFRIASFYAQKFSGRSARIHFSRHVKKARNPLSRHVKSAFSSLLWWLGQCDTNKHMQCSSFTLKWIEHLKCKCSADPWFAVQIVLKSSGQYWNRTDSIETVRTILKPSRQYWNRLDSIETVRTVLKPSGHYWNCPDNIETLRTELKPSGQYWNRPDSIETIRTVLKSSGQ